MSEPEEKEVVQEETFIEPKVEIEELQPQVEIEELQAEQAQFFGHFQKILRIILGHDSLGEVQTEQEKSQCQINLSLVEEE